MPYLQGLTISHNKLTELKQIMFNSLPNLVVLHISLNNLTSLKKNTFQGK
jgi:Leucine-rich repeat (LRR) protein